MQLSPLWTGITLARFTPDGTVPVDIDRLIRYVKGLAKCSIFGLPSVMDTLSKPVALPPLKAEDRFLISISVTGLRETDSLIV